MVRYSSVSGFFLTLGLVIFSLPAMAQKGGATTPTRPPAPSPSPNTNTPNTIPNNNNRNNNPEYGAGEMQRPIFLSGKVVMDDGTPPTESVTIEMICAGAPRPQGYTGSKGRFSFQLGQQNMVLSDASMESSAISGQRQGGFGQTGVRTNNGLGSGRTGRPNLMGCDLRAVLPGFRSDQVSLNSRQSFDNPDVGTIVLHRLSNVQGTTISAISLAAPKDAKKAYDKGIDAMSKQKPEDAIAHFEKAVAVYPKYASAWYELGRLQAMRGQAEEAHKSLLQSISADPKYVSPHVEVAKLSARERKWEEALTSSSEALRLNPVEFPLAYFLNAVANLNLHHLDAAEKSVREAIKLDPQMQNPKEAQVLSVILREKGDVAGAAEQMRTYIKLAPNAPDIAVAKSDLVEMEKKSVAEAPGKSN